MSNKKQGTVSKISVDFSHKKLKIQLSPSKNKEGARSQETAQNCKWEILFFKAITSNNEMLSWLTNSPIRYP